MIKSKKIKRELLVSILSMIMCLAMFICSTYAWFSDTVTSGNNQIIAGNLDVELLHSNAKVTDAKVKVDSDLFVDKEGKSIKWEPGVMTYENFTVQNVGSLALKYQLKVNVNGFNTITVDGQQKSLKDVLKVVILDEHFKGNREDIVNLMENATTIDQFNKNDSIVAKDPDKKYAMVIYWQPTSDDNIYNLNNGNKADDQKNHLYIDLGVTLSAIQKDQENDSFGNDYDHGINPPVMTNADLKNALSKSGKVILGSNVTYGKDNVNLIQVKYATTLDLGGHNITFDAIANTTGKPAPIVVTGGRGNLVINGNGMIDTTNRGYCISVKGPSGLGKAKLTINGGTFKGQATAIQAETNSSIEINGGFFQCSPTDQGSYEYLINRIDDATNASITIKGGTFVNFNPADNLADGSDTNYVADGYEVIAEIKDNGDIWYTVVESNIDIDETEEEDPFG